MKTRSKPAKIMAKSLSQNATQPGSTNRPCYILDLLPPEIRNHIYSYNIQDNKLKAMTYHNTDRFFREKVPGLLQTCRQMRDESQRLFHFESTFHISASVDTGFSNNQQHWLASMSPKRAAQCRKIELSFDQEAIVECPSTRPGAVFARCWRANLPEIDYTGRDGASKQRMFDFLLSISRSCERSAKLVIIALLRAGFCLDQIRIVKPLSSKWDLPEYYREKMFEAWRIRIEIAVRVLRAYEGVLRRSST